MLRLIVAILPCKSHGEERRIKNQPAVISLVLDKITMMGVVRSISSGASEVLFLPLGGRSLKAGSFNVFVLSMALDRLHESC